jgi:hypothetical protein
MSTKAANEIAGIIASAIRRMKARPGVTGPRDTSDAAAPASLETKVLDRDNTGRKQQGKPQTKENRV